MRINAEYIGKTEKFGVKPGKTYEVELNTYISKDGESYIWVEALETDYLMPFVGLRAMMLDWRFIEDEEDLEGRQAELEDRWYETYYPVVVTP